MTYPLPRSWLASRWRSTLGGYDGGAADVLEDEMKHSPECWKNAAVRELGVGGPLASCTCGADMIPDEFRLSEDEYLHWVHERPNFPCAIVPLEDAMTTMTPDELRKAAVSVTFLIRSDGIALDDTEALVLACHAAADAWENGVMVWQDAYYERDRAYNVLVKRLEAAEYELAPWRAFAADPNGMLAKLLALAGEEKP